MLYGFLIAFLISFVIGISIAIVIVIALREVTSHIYEGGSQNIPMQSFRSHLRHVLETEEAPDRKKASHHRHYQA